MSENSAAKINRVLMVVMDGVGVRTNDFGNAFNLARHPHLDLLQKTGIYRTIFAHGAFVGMPSDQDLGNSEVGHNAIGAGRVFDQGAKLVSAALKSGALFEGECWKNICQITKTNQSCLHLMGLLSDGNVHSHEEHLFALVRGAKAAGIQKVRIHALLDGRDVAESSAEIYATRLRTMIDALKDEKFDVAIASGGGRMIVTMDRYEADLSIVERGWNAHVHGVANFYFASLEEAIAEFRAQKLTDQYFPAFVIRGENGEALGKIKSGDAVVMFNFRGDRAIEISKAFEDTDFNHFDRGEVPRVFFAGMTQYDGDLKIPKNFLVTPPLIDHTLGEFLAQQGIRQFACSETQKFGHVTYFWNGNRSGMFDPSFEEYLEIPSDRVQFDQLPAMKAKEITDATIERIAKNTFDFARINFANGDMVGHTGNLKAAIYSVETVDQMIGKLKDACQTFGVTLLVTADHGNCEEMFDAKPERFPNWKYNVETSTGPIPPPKTSHTLNPVPVYVDTSQLDKEGLTVSWDPTITRAGLSNLANTILSLLGLPNQKRYDPSLVKVVRNALV